MDLFQDPNEFWLESDSSTNEENPNEEANDINEIQFIKEVIHVESTAPPPGTSKEPKPYVCPFCQWSGTNNRGVFKAHIKNLHPEEDCQTENKSAQREEDGEPPAKKLEIEEVKAEASDRPKSRFGRSSAKLSDKHWVQKFLTKGKVWPNWTLGQSLCHTMDAIFSPEPLLDFCMHYMRYYRLSPYLH